MFCHYFALRKWRKTPEFSPKGLHSPSMRLFCPSQAVHNAQVQAISSATINREEPRFGRNGGIRQGPLSARAAFGKDGGRARGRIGGARDGIREDGAFPGGAGRLERGPCRMGPTWGQNRKFPPRKGGGDGKRLGGWLCVRVFLGGCLLRFGAGLGCEIMVER